MGGPGSGRFPAKTIKDGKLQCWLCKKWKAMKLEFGPDKRTTSGRSGVCRLCDRQRTANRRKIKRDYLNTLY